MIQFSFFKNGVRNNKPSATVSLTDAMEAIKSDTYAAKVAAIRKCTSKDVARPLKGSLDYYTFSGTFAPTRLAENLVEHSGLLTIDLDDVENLTETKLQVYQDPFVLVGFVSPSGTGLKLLIQLEDNKNHLSSFLDFGVYMLNTYGLAIDQSGKDVNRPCFVSHDPDLYYNPDAKPYRIIGHKPATTQKVAVDDYDKTRKHITAVVERIEASNTNITGDNYSDYLLIAFSLAGTLGENGRDLFHRVCRISTKYDETNANDKFTNAIKTTRFNAPGKFFSIAKSYGIDITKPRMMPEKKGMDFTTLKPEKKLTATTEKPPKPTKQKKQQDDGELETVQYTESGGIWIKIGRFGSIVAQNFQIYIKYKTIDEKEEITWILEINTTDGETIYLELAHEDFCSAKKLKNEIAKKQLALKINDSELDELRSYLFTKTIFPVAEKVVRYGFNADSNLFFFANKVLNTANGELLTPDDFGIVTANQKHLSVPVSAKAKTLRYSLTDNEVSFNHFFSLYAQAHGYENAFVPTCFYIMSLYRDLCIQYKNFSPILFLKGGAGTGKSSMVRILTAMFGRKQEGVNLKSKNTDSALVKLMSQTSNSIIWFDEYHNDFPHEGLLQAAYDNDGYHRSSDSSSIETNAVEIYSALALTSNYLPQNPIFFSRCVFVPITAQQKSDQQRAAFYTLEEIQEKGLGCITIELLKHRPDVLANENFVIAYDRLYNAFRDEFKGEKVPERLFANMSQVMSVAFVLTCLRKIEMIADTSATDVDILQEFVSIGAANIRRQFRIQNESNAASEFFEILQQLYEQYQLHEDVHFRFNSGDIMLRFPQLYNLFAQKYRQINMKTPPEKDTIQTELALLAGKNDWSEIEKQVRFANDFEGNSQAKHIPIKSCCTIPYELLCKSFGLDFQNRKNRDSESSGKIF